MEKTRKIFVFFLLTIFLFNINCFASAQEIELESKSAILIETETGKEIIEKNADEKLPIASVTKIMTLLLTMEAIENGRIHLDDVVTASENASNMGGSTIFLAKGEKMTVNELLKAISVASANDASVAIAEHIAGTQDSFVKMMNEKAKELGMENTHFENCNGLDADNHYSSARDVSIMSRELVIKYPDVHKWLTIWVDHLREDDKVFDLNNTNKLIKFYDGCDGIKTGSTSQAKFCLSATAKRNGLRLISVVLGGPTSQKRFKEASDLLNYGFANYEIAKIAQSDKVLKKIKVLNGKEEEVKAILPDDINILLKKGEKEKLSQDVKIQDSLEAPVEKGQKVGEYILMLDNKQMKKYDIISDKEIRKANTMDMFKKILAKWMY
ncbi:MAG: D-alanyl-D-alanine carboxypeptidase [Clostridia bacterium]|nr:D-alanyl-D-alanine carboxypeptidase [Clostridia bacterium]